MMFVATLVHPPELCLARQEYAAEFKHWAGMMNENAQKLGITVHGAYSCPNEHTFYFIIESEDFLAIPAFFSGVMLANNTGRITPVVPLKQASDTLIK